MMLAHIHEAGRHFSIRCFSLSPWCTHDPSNLWASNFIFLRIPCLRLVGLNGKGFTQLIQAPNPSVTRLSDSVAWPKRQEPLRTASPVSAKNRFTRQLTSWLPGSAAWPPRCRRRGPAAAPPRAPAPPRWPPPGRPPGSKRRARRVAGCKTGVGSSHPGQDDKAPMALVVVRQNDENTHEIDHPSSLNLMNKTPCSCSYNLWDLHVLHVQWRIVTVHP